MDDKVEETVAGDVDDTASKEYAGSKASSAASRSVGLIVFKSLGDTVGRSTTAPPTC